MKRIISIAAVLLIICGSVIAFSSCGLGKSIVGVWEAKIKARDFFDSFASSDDPEVLDLVGDSQEALKEIIKRASISGNITCRMELKENGTYESIIIESDIEKLMTQFADGFLDYANDLIKQQGQTVSENDLIKAIGFDSKDGLVDKLIGEFEDGIKEGKKGNSDKYTYEDGVLELNGNSFSVELSDDTLVYKEKVSGDGASFINEEMLPLVWTRVD